MPLPTSAEMRELPVFSIVIPTRNASPLIAECLSSIIEQTFKSYEIIVVDGGSSDNTLDIVSRCADNALNTHLVALRQKGRGIYDAMNDGIKSSNGRFLLFLGADDKLANQYVLELVQNALKFSLNADAIIGMVLIDGTHRFQPSMTGLTWRNTLHHQGVFYSKSLFNRIGLYRDEFRVYGDYEFNLRMRNKNASIFQIDFPVAHAASAGISGRPRWDNCREQMAVRSLHVTGLSLIMANAVSILAFALKAMRLRR